MRFTLSRGIASLVEQTLGQTSLQQRFAPSEHSPEVEQREERHAAFLFPVQAARWRVYIAPLSGSAMIIIESEASLASTGP